jgi:hypothetical protein
MPAIPAIENDTANSSFWQDRRNATQAAADAFRDPATPTNPLRWAVGHWHACASGRYRDGMVGVLAVVEGWLDAVNEQDAAHVEALSSERVEIVGPRGQGLMDRSVLGQWLARAGFTAQALRWFCGADGRVVVEQQAQWRDVVTGEPQDRLVIGSEFVVRDGRVTRYVRHDSGVTAALDTAGLDERQNLVTHRQ